MDLFIHNTSGLPLKSIKSQTLNSRAHGEALIQVNGFVPVRFSFLHLRPLAFTLRIMTTIRQQIIAILEQGLCDARDLSGELGISEKEVYAHLPHVGKSVASQGKKLHIQPARCLACGFVFGSRKRVTRPGRCPKCKNQRIQSPRFEVG